MTQIFVSYASEDRDHARSLAQALEQLGFSTWWDRKIPFGRPYDEVIAESLAAAGCVLVLWTGTSVESRWVRSEASEAAAREVLIPVLLERGVKIPLEFRLLHAADLSEWEGDPDYPEFKALVAQIEARLASASAHGHAPSAGPLQPSQAGTHDGSMPPPRDAARRAAARWRGSRRFVHFAGFIAIPSVLILAAAAFAMTWRMPTRVQLDLVVDRVTFTLAGNRPVDVPANALSFALLSVENFDRVTFSPRRLRVPTAASERAEPAPGAWREAATRGVLVLSGADDERALLTLDRGGDTAPAGRLQPLSAAPGARVTLEARSGPPARMTLRMDGQALQTNLLPDGEVHLAASHVAIEGLGVPTAGEGEIALQVTLPQDDPFLQVQGARRFFVVTAMVAEAGPVPLLDRAEVKEIEFLRQGSGGAIESALVAGGELTYPGHSGIARRTLAPGDFVGLGSLNAATLTRLELNADRGGIQVRFDGVAGKLDVSSGGVAQDLRVSALEALWHNAQAAVLLSIAVWAIAVSTGAYRLYRDFQTT